MSKRQGDVDCVVVVMEGDRRIIGRSLTTGGHDGPFKRMQWWSLRHKPDVVSRMFGGGPVLALNRTGPSGGSGHCLCASPSFVGINLLVDMLYGYLNPQITYSSEK